MARMLEVNNIFCSYDHVPVIHGISGSISFCGEDISKKPAFEIIKHGISYVPEGRRLFAKLSVRENLELGAFSVTDKSVVAERIEEMYELFPVTDKSVVAERIEEMYELFPILKDRSEQTAETMSGGEQQMCAIARGLMSRPKLILLDELSLGLQPSLVERVLETVTEIRKRGVTVLLVEQMVQEALEIADRGYVLQTGRVVHEGTAHELLNSDEVRKAYMGM